jgi:hypothetical protein
MSLTSPRTPSKQCQSRQLQQFFDEISDCDTNLSMAVSADRDLPRFMVRLLSCLRRRDPAVGIAMEPYRFESQMRR